MNQTYTFFLPKPCANLALVSSEPSREKARLDAEKAAAEKAAAEKLAAEKAAAERARMEAERRARERAEAERLAQEKAAAEKAAAERAAAEKAAAEKAEAERIARVKDEKVDWFVSALFGKERRTREIETSGTTVTTADVSQCSPLLGAKFGPEFKVGPNFKIAPGIGGAINFEKGGNSSLFAEVEFNGYTAGLKNYIGASVGLWDLTHSDWITPTIGVQAGTQIWTNAKEDKIYLVAEGKVFARMFGAGLSNNYQFWGGLRYVNR
jgi:hypothetical protein